ncbi:diacylglycerol kinase family protein [Marinifilum sp. D737]|uniref:diacylglycerol kinase family protein n=1 Tax=Marinifilum sp. D737 TaxID=2969628 RepID=UPI0022724989|nr:diacylglycerol kinase family protein [Marinifilum sp. D737]MCY1633606.1 diacylglycerol kinase family protein [Marinifilum sp. D737]
MNKKSKFSIKAQLNSFKHALRGLKITIKEEDNAKIHLGIGIIMYVLSAVLKLKKIEIIAVLFSIGFVIVAELFNTAIENLCDYIHPDRHKQIKKIKDISAAAVLISAITAFLVGLMIYTNNLIIESLNLL